MRWRSLLGIVGLAMVPVAGHSLRSGSPERCALDGGRIEPAYRVEIVDGSGIPHGFCCVLCADYWLSRQAEPPGDVLVTDEASGRPLDAEEAWYVESAVVTAPVTGNRIHVFARKQDAERHAETCRGRILKAGERPPLAEGRSAGGPSQ